MIGDSIEVPARMRFDSAIVHLFWWSYDRIWTASTRLVNGDHPVQDHAPNVDEEGGLHMISAVDLANQIIAMRDKIQEQENHIERIKQYEEMYHKIMESNRKHGHAMQANYMELMMIPGVAQLFEAHKK